MSGNKQIVARYRMNYKGRMANMVVSLLLRLGLKVGSVTLLTVKGRKTGLARTNPVAIWDYDGHKYLVSAHGDVNWVQNLRASQEASFLRGRHSEAKSVIEINPIEAAPILKKILPSNPSFSRSYLHVKSDSPLEIFQAVAINHPVFEIREHNKTDL